MIAYMKIIARSDDKAYKIKAISLIQESFLGGCWRAFCKIAQAGTFGSYSQQMEQQQYQQSYDRSVRKLFHYLIPTFSPWMFQEGGVKKG